MVQNRRVLLLVQGDSDRLQQGLGLSPGVFPLEAFIEQALVSGMLVNKHELLFAVLHNEIGAEGLPNYAGVEFPHRGSWNFPRGGFLRGKGKVRWGWRCGSLFRLAQGRPLRQRGLRAGGCHRVGFTVQHLFQKTGEGRCALRLPAAVPQKDAPLRKGLALLGDRDWGGTLDRPLGRGLGRGLGLQAELFLFLQNGGVGVHRGPLQFHDFGLVPGVKGGFDPVVHRVENGALIDKEMCIRDRALQVSELMEAMRDQAGILFASDRR